MKYDNVTRIFTSTSPRSSKTCVGQGNRMKMHVLCLDFRVNFLVGLERLLNDQRGCVMQTAKGSLGIGNTYP